MSQINPHHHHQHHQQQPPHPFLLSVCQIPSITPSLYSLLPPSLSSTCQSILPSFSSLLFFSPSLFSPLSLPSSPPTPHPPTMRLLTKMATATRKRRRININKSN